MYFHAQYRQEFPAKAGQDYLLFDGEGDGIYVGRSSPSTWSSRAGTARVTTVLHRRGRRPQLRGTGTEDYFCDGWGFRKFNMPSTA